MKIPRINWTEDEINQAIDLYIRTPFGRIDKGNPEVIALAAKLGRTPSSIALKMSNLASIDETLDRRGMANSSKLDRLVWQKFFDRLKSLGATLSPPQYDSPITGLSDNEQEIILGAPQGLSIQRIANARQGQEFFRRIVLSSYENRCAITGINQRELLVAGHIKSWSSDPENRMNPRNGICLNRLHDRAFEDGLISITPSGQIEYSRHLMPSTRDKMILLNDAGSFNQPIRFKPDPAFLEYHRDVIFQS
jgi:putative restriction endonuclease